MAIHELDARLGDMLGMVTAGLCKFAIGTSDVVLRESISQALVLIDAVGLVAHFPTDEVTLYCFTQDPQEGIIRRILAKVSDLERDRRKNPGKRRKHGAVLTLNQLDETVHLLREPEHFIGIIPFQRFSGRTTASSALDYGALIYSASSAGPLNPHEERRNEFHARSTLRLLFQVLRYRVRGFAPFSGRISQWYWEHTGLEAPEKTLQPPWMNENDPLATATLSLDLRKSTFCMEQADRPNRFADWLDQLGQILTRISHMHGGVFDKFTGDGALVHFLERECRKVFKRDAVVAALACAVDMQRALEFHLDKLRNLLRFDSKLLGAGIGIDVAPAFWKVDHRGNPITVGRGIVGACRICDGTPAKMISLTNIAYQELRKAAENDRYLRRVVLGSPHLRRKVFVSKEFKDEMKIRIWQFNKPPKARHSTDSARIHSLCNDVYEQSEA